jgi:hypothetical protein
MATKATQREALNLSIHPSVIEKAKTLADSLPRESVSSLVEKLLIKHLQKEGVSVAPQKNRKINK